MLLCYCRDTRNNDRQWVEKDDKPPEPKKKKEDVDSILTRTGTIFIVLVYLLGDIIMLLINIGGAYIPPARLRMMQEQIEDKSRWALFRMMGLCTMYNMFYHITVYPIREWPGKL